MLIYISSNIYVFIRCSNHDMYDFLGFAKSVFFLSTAFFLNFLMCFFAFFLQVKRMNSFLLKKEKNKRMKRDYHNIIENFAEGILVASDKNEVFYINEELSRFIEYDKESFKELDVTD